MKDKKQIVIEEGMKRIADKVSSLSSLQNEALRAVIKGTYMGVLPQPPLILPLSGHE